MPDFMIDLSGKIVLLVQAYTGIIVKNIEVRLMNCVTHTNRVLCIFERAEGKPLFNINE